MKKYLIVKIFKEARIKIDKIKFLHETKIKRKEDDKEINYHFSKRSTFVFLYIYILHMEMSQRIGHL